MTLNGHASRNHRSWRILLGVLCIALVVLSGVIAVSHDHANGVEHGECGLCTTAHVTIQTASSATLIPVPLEFVRLRASLAPVQRTTRPVIFALFTRPPPVAASLS